MGVRTRIGVGLVLLAGVLAAPRGSQAADVAGSWQINISCGLFATATSFVDIADDGAGNLTVTTPVCGTLEVPGAIHQLTTCVFTPDPRDGLVSGATVSFPASSLGHSDSTTDTPFNFVGLCQAARVVNESAFDGTVVEEAAGVATRISGTVVNGLLQVYRPDTSLCFSLLDSPDCTFDMRRNAVAAGSNVTVAPRDGSRVTFESILAPGTAAVVPVTTPSATVPANFTVLDSGGVPIYYDVHTTAVHAGSITTCFAYPDVNNDGLIDSTGEPETSLRVLHEESGTFVDRTLSVDTDANLICAETSSLSQLTLASQPAVGAPLVCSAQPRLGCKHSHAPSRTQLKIVDSADDSADQLQWAWRRGDAISVNDFADPFNIGGTDYALCIYDLSAAPPAPIFAAQIPRNVACGQPDCWDSIPPKRIRYRQPSGAPHGVSEAQVRTGGDGQGRVKVQGNGAALSAGPFGMAPLPLPLPARVQVQVQNGVCYEADFDDTGLRRNDGQRFTGRASQ